MVNLDCGAGLVKVSIECDGRKLEEYSLSPVSGTRQQCYIASEVNKAGTGMPKSILYICVQVRRGGTEKKNERRVGSERNAP